MSKVKICGLRRVEDIAAVNSALPDYIGFVFAPSRRRIDEQTASMLKEMLDPRIQAVGVFVNQDIKEAASLVQRGILDAVQLHGDEDEEYLIRLKESCGCPVIKSVSVGEALPPLPENADYLLFDAASDQRGGSGRTFDWALLQQLHSKPYFLAGGLDLQNISNALRVLSPFCVDVSSGVETGGFKDAEKIHQFIDFVRKASR
ncbi:MAG: phosphoribosylanthranilate isomerase [Clostridiales bacterium]|nr:phosphoribosylanthranilate isomerase [Clostridiales bacterium]